MKKVALVGYGKFAPKHLDVLRALDVDLVGACNRSEAGRKKATEEGKIARTYATIGELIAKEKPDGILCTASVDGIFPAAKEIIASGIPSMLEKPPGTTLAEYEELCVLAKKHDTPVMVAFNRRHYSVVKKAIEDMGGVDKVTGVFIDWTEDPQHLLNTGHTRNQVERMIFGNSIHGIDLLTWFSGPIPKPQVVARDLGGESFRWVMALQGVSESGAIASFRSTWDSPGRWRVEVTSKDRRYLFAPLETCKVTQRGTKEERVLEPDPIDASFKAGLHSQARAFLEMIDTRKAPVGASLESGRPSMALAEQLTNAVLSASAR